MKAFDISLEIISYNLITNFFNLSFLDCRERGLFNANFISNTQLFIYILMGNFIAKGDDLIRLELSARFGLALTRSTTISHGRCRSNHHQKCPGRNRRRPSRCGTLGLGPDPYQARSSTSGIRGSTSRPRSIGLRAQSSPTRLRGHRCSRSL